MDAVGASGTDRHGGKDTEIRVLRCVNLRPSPTEKGLVAALPPAIAVSGAPYSPLCHPRPGQLLAANNTRLTLVTLKDNGSAGSVKPHAATLPSPPACACSDADGETIVSGRGYLRKIATDTGGEISTQIDPRAEIPAISLRASAGSSFSADCGGRRLSAVYSDGQRLAAQDRRSVSDDITDTYCRLSASAAVSGKMIQPAIVRYRLFDSLDREIFTGPPLLLSPEGGSQCTDAVELLSTDGQNISGYTLTAKSWQIAVVIPDCPDMELRTRVAKLEVYVSPQFHPFSPAASPAVYGSRGGNLVGRVALPGAGSGLTGGAATSISRLHRALLRLDSIENPATIIHYPFSRGARTILVEGFAPEADARTCASALEKALRTPVAAACAVPPLLMPPNIVSGACVCREASAVAWGNLSAVRFAGYSPAAFASGTASQAWEGYARVRFRGSDGEAVLRLSCGSGSAPLTLNPVLSYPDPEAIEMEICLQSGGKIYGAKYPLTPLGSMAVYTGTTLLPFALPERQGEYSVPTGQTEIHDFPGYVAIASTSDPLRPRLVADCGAGEVKAISALRSRGQSWEFGRCPFYVFTDDGISVLTTGKDFGSISLRRLDDRGVDNGGAVANAGSAIYALLKRGDAGCQLVKISAAGTATLVADAPAWKRLAWVASDGELWALGESENEGTTVFCPQCGMKTYTRPEIYASATADCAGESYILCGTRLLRPSVKMPDEAVEVEWCAEWYSRPERHIVPSAVRLVASGDTDKAMLEIGPPQRLAPAGSEFATRFAISGTILSPIRLRILSRPLQGIRAGFSGRAGSSFILKSIDTTIHEAAKP